MIPKLRSVLLGCFCSCFTCSSAPVLFGRGRQGDEPAGAPALWSMKASDGIVRRGPSLNAPESRLGCFKHCDPATAHHGRARPTGAAVEDATANGRPGSIIPIIRQRAQPFWSEQEPPANCGRVPDAKGPSYRRQNFETGRDRRRLGHLRPLNGCLLAGRERTVLRAGPPKAAG